MPADLECIPCLCREAVLALRTASHDPALREAVLGEALFHLAMRDPASPPDALAEDLRSLIASRTQQPIPPLTAHTPCQHRLPTR
jgi:hypothetical protein